MKSDYKKNKYRVIPHITNTASKVVKQYKVQKKIFLGWEDITNPIDRDFATEICKEFNEMTK